MRSPAQTFEAWWEQYGQPYEAAVIKRCGTPWTADVDERRALWQRRYQRPAPPAGMSTIKSLREFVAA